MTFRPMTQRHLDHWPEGVPQRLPDLPASAYASLRRSAAAQGGRPALEFFGRRTGYDALLAEVEALARGMRRLGLRPGDRVLLCLQNTPQFVIAFHAISAAAAVVVPVNPMSSRDELAYLAQDAGAAMMVFDQGKIADFAPLLDGAAGQGAPLGIVATYADHLPDRPGVTVPAFIAAPAAVPDHPRLLRWGAVLDHDAVDPLPDPDPAAMSIMPYTSGTTGRPKGCIHTNRSMMTTGAASALWLGMDAEARQLVTLPLFHVTGMQVCMTAGILSGGTLHLLPRWDRDAAVDILESARITMWIAIAAMVIDVVNGEGIDRRDLSALRMIMGGGAAMPEAVAARLHALTGLDYVEGYGLSETAAPVLINPPARPRRACLGVPLMEVDARVIDTTTLAEVGDDVTGEIVIHAPQVFQGYWNRPEASAEAFIEIDGKRFLRTGDLGYRDAEGYFRMVDRLKRMINAAGYKVWPTEVEAVLFRHPAVREACIISTPDERRGESVKAVVVRRDGDNTGAAEIIGWCRERMSAYKVPRELVFVDSLPKSGTGKVMWRQLQEQEWA